MQTFLPTAFVTCLLARLPVAASVSISSPTNGAVVSSPVRIDANNGGRRASFSVYVNGLLITQQRTTSIEASVDLDPGTYVVRVVAQSQGRISEATSNITIASAAPAPPTSPDPPAPPPATTSIAVQIGSDMQGRHEGMPHGVPPSYDWSANPVSIMGNSANGWQAITAWGTLYEAAEGNPAVNTRVNIRNMQTYFLQKSSGKWLLLQNTSRPEGAAYLEDFSGDVNRAADVRTEVDGTISAKAGGGYNFHFYPTNRASINPNDMGGVVVVLQARLIVGDPGKPDDRSTARYLLGAGADYYPGLTGGWPGTADFNPGVAIGKMKYVQPDWRSFAMTTITLDQMQNNPPPVNLRGIAP